MPANKPVSGRAATQKPKQSWTAIVQRALKARERASEYAAALGARVPAASLTTLDNDVASLQASIPAAKTSSKGALHTTAAQNTALQTGHRLVIACHKAVQADTKDKAVLTAYGIGGKNRLIVRDVVSSLSSIIDRMTALPDEAAGFGLVADDLTALQAARTEINTTNVAQEAARAAKPLSTKNRNVIARRILATIEKIKSAGMRAFARDPATHAIFEAL